MRLEDFKYDMERCIGCSGCRWVDHIYMSGVKYGQRCPSIDRYLFNDHLASGRLKIANAFIEKRLDYSPYLLDVIYRCNLCGACDVGCKRNLDLEVLSVLESLRVRAVEDGQGPMAGQKACAENILNKKNRYGGNQKTRFDWMDKESISNPEVLYFAGCAASFVKKSVAQSTAAFLNKLGVGFSVLNEEGSQEWCCGHPLIVTGQIKDARNIVEHHLKSIRDTGAKTILTSCAECYKTWKVDYPKIMGLSTEDLGFQVVHLVELIDDLIGKGGIQFNREVKMKVTYHDPCNLGRLSEPWMHWEGKRGKYGVLEPPKKFRLGTYGIYDPPRRILKSIPGIELGEMIRYKENAYCCGSGGGVKEAFKEFSLWTASRRIEEAEETGAEAIITACPYCEQQFEEVVKSKGLNIRVLDMAELIDLAL